MPLLDARKTSRSNSLGVRLTSSPLTRTVWLAVSMVNSPKVMVPSVLSLRGMVRLSTALTRATSSRGKRLDHIIVGAAFKARQLIVFLAAGRQDDDRRVDVAGAHLPQTGHAVHERHHQIEDHQIISAAAQQRKCRRTVARFLADIARILQVLPDQLPDPGFIINDQNFLPSVAPSSRNNF